MTMNSDIVINNNAFCPPFASFYHATFESVLGIIMQFYALTCVFVYRIPGPVNTAVHVFPGGVYSL